MPNLDSKGIIIQDQLTGFGLNEYPSKINILNSGEHLTIGDLHANAMKLLFFLIKEQVLQLKPNEDQRIYNLMLAIYNKTGEKNFKDFEKYLNKFQINPKAKNVTIRLLGGEVEKFDDKDYFTLLILQKLKENSIKHNLNLNVEIMFSNPAAQFVKVFEQRPDLQSNFTKLIEKYYQPNLKLLSYVITNADPQGIKIYSHAPVGVETIKGLAEHFGINYPETELNIERLTLIIDQINRKFLELVTAKKISISLQQEAAIIGQSNIKSGKLDPKYASIHRIIRNKKKSDIFMNRPYTLKVAGKKISLYYVHGHDDHYRFDDKDEQQHIVNLCNTLGKSVPSATSEFYRVEKLRKQDYITPLVAPTIVDISTQQAMDRLISDLDSTSYPQLTLKPQSAVTTSEELQQLPAISMQAEEIYSSIEPVQIIDDPEQELLETSTIKPEVVSPSDSSAIRTYDDIGLNLRTVKIIQHDKYQTKQNQQAKINDDYIRSLHDKLITEIMPLKESSLGGKDHYTAEQITKFNHERKQLYQNLNIQKIHNTINIINQDKIICKIKPSEMVDQLPSKQLLINGAASNIDLILNTVLQSKKTLGNCKYIIYPSDNFAAVIELYHKAKACGLNPELRNYPAKSNGYISSWSDQKFAEFTQRVKTATKEYSIPEVMKKKKKL